MQSEHEWTGEGREQVPMRECSFGACYKNVSQRPEDCSCMMVTRSKGYSISVCIVRNSSAVSSAVISLIK